MAEIKTGILGGMSGKIGSVVGAIWRGKNILRTVPRKSSKKATTQQLKQRSRFAAISAFLRPLNYLLAQYYGSDQGYKSRVNLALAYHLKEAVDDTGDVVFVQLEKVVLSKGILPSVSMGAATVNEGALVLTWSYEESASLGKDTDLLSVVVYGKNSNDLLIAHRVTTRNASGFSLQLPKSLETDDCFVWYFLTNVQDDECSTSMFISTAPAPLVEG